MSIAKGKFSVILKDLIYHVQFNCVRILTPDFQGCYIQNKVQCCQNPT